MPEKVSKSENQQVSESASQTSQNFALFMSFGRVPNHSIARP